MSDKQAAVTESVRDQRSPDWLELVREHAASLQFGSVLITVHESRVVQVEKSEKLRLDAGARTAANSTNKIIRR